MNQPMTVKVGNSIPPQTVADGRDTTRQNTTDKTFCQMVRLIANEFLTEERDRKYYADHYTCCPPPLFILLVTLIERKLRVLSENRSGTVLIVTLSDCVTVGRIADVKVHNEIVCDRAVV
ncbi:hypothetical protein RUM44_011100 [Polyplax serrata]|uniref:Uncharacterized protein n=1 Tax=Polyplax serrata TaxID=468196 RepID=A0ABR1AP77_POLSC